MEDRFRFRVFDYDENKMIYFSSLIGIETPHHDRSSQPNLYNDYVYHKISNYMQCTGLKDRNGKVIYEGDIVKLSGNDNPYMNNIIGVVKYSQEYAIFFINIPNNIAWYEFCEVNKKELKIIGNIYENPELLNVYTLSIAKEILKEQK